MSPMVLALLPLVLTAITVVVIVRAWAQMADELDQLRTAVARVDALRPAAAQIGAGARALSDGISQLVR